MKRLWHIFLAAINLLLAIVFLLSAFGGTVSPESSVIPALVSMLFPFFLPLMLIALVSSCFISWKAVIFNIVIIACCAGPILNICPLNFNAPKLVKASNPTTRFSLMTYNVMELNNLHDRDSNEKEPRTRTVQYMADSGCDIIAYQEAYNLHSPQYPEVSTEALNALRTAYPYIACGKNSYVGLLSKYPVKYIPVNIADTQSFHAECYEVDINGKIITIVNVHLQSIGLNSEDKNLYRQLTDGGSVSMDTVKHTLLHKLKVAFKARARQAIKLRHFINELRGPVIVCGDFNDIPGCYAQRALMGHDMRDAYRDAALGPAITYHDNRFYFRIDHILYRGVSPLKVKVRANGFSDHYPVVGTFSTTPDLHIQ